MQDRSFSNVAQPPVYIILQTSLRLIRIARVSLGGRRHLFPKAHDVTGRQVSLMDYGKSQLMIDGIIKFSIHNKLLVGLFVIALASWGGIFIPSDPH